LREDLDRADLNLKISKCGVNVNFLLQVDEKLIRIFFADERLCTNANEQREAFSKSFQGGKTRFSFFFQLNLKIENRRFSHSATFAPQFCCHDGTQSHFADEISNNLNDRLIIISKVRARMSLVGHLLFCFCRTLLARDSLRLRKSQAVTLPADQEDSFLAEREGSV
jgi:hypothetical protein